MEQLLAQLPGDPATNMAAIGSVILAVVAFIVGSVRAIANRTWVPEAFATWVRAHLASQVFPIVFLAIVSQAFGTITVGTFSFNLVATAVQAAAATYAVSAGKAIFDSLNPKAPDPVPPDAV
jgi:hypothetical protein